MKILRYFQITKLLVSIAAGVTIEAIKKIINKNIYVARAMPNLCAVINESITGICKEVLLNLIRRFYKKYL